MKKLICLTIAAALTTVLAACTIQSAPRVQPPAGAAATAAVTGTTAATAAETSAAPTASPKATAPVNQTVMPPVQGGDMLYPVFAQSWMPGEEEDGIYHYTRIGIIDQTGKTVTEPRFDSFYYHKGADGKTDCVIAYGGGTVYVYNLDGTVALTIEGAAVGRVCDSIPFLVIDLSLSAEGGGPAPDYMKQYTVYDLRTMQKALVYTYNAIAFIDTHTAVMRSYDVPAGTEYAENPASTDYLYDFDNPAKKKIPLDGYVPDISRGGGYGSPYVETAACIPAVQGITPGSYGFDGQTGTTVYLGRDGHVLPGRQGTEPNTDGNYNESIYYDFYGSSPLHIEGYNWTVEGNFQGYKDKNGAWVYKTSRYLLLDD